MNDYCTDCNEELQEGEQVVFSTVNPDTFKHEKCNEDKQETKEPELRHMYISELVPIFKPISDNPNFYIVSIKSDLSKDALQGLMDKFVTHVKHNTLIDIKLKVSEVPDDQHHLINKEFKL